MSPTSLAISRATGQLVPDAAPPVMYPGPPPPGQAQDFWGYNPQYPQPQAHLSGFGYPGYAPPYIQPHINPRFASAFGMGYHHQAQQASQYAGSYSYDGMGVASAGGAYSMGGWNGGWTYVDTNTSPSAPTPAEGEGDSFTTMDRVSEHPEG